MKRALLLNADYTPLHFVSEEDAIYLLYKERVEMIVMHDGKPSKWKEGHGLVNGGEFPAGATLRLMEYVHKKWKPPRFRKRVLFNRDHWCCQYCGVELTHESITVDHIIPSSRGGRTSWLNCVASCKQCNRTKGNKTPDEANMHLRCKPREPSPLHFWDVNRYRCRVQNSKWHNDWDAFLPKAR